MNKTLKNILAVIAGIIGGSVVNMGIISISGSVIPPPIGVDVSTMEGLKAAMPLFGPEHFLMPILAHALGKFVGAFIAAKIAPSNELIYAMGIGVFFLLGGIVAVIQLPSPLWFNIVDLTLAYIPMAYLAGVLAKRN